MTIQNLGAETTFVSNLTSQPIQRGQMLMVGGQVRIVINHIDNYYAELIGFAESTHMEDTTSGWYNATTMVKVDIEREKFKYPERFI